MNKNRYNINTSKDIIENYTERYYDDGFFLYYIDHVEDDHDDSDSQSL